MTKVRHKDVGYGQRPPFFHFFHFFQKEVDFGHIFCPFRQPGRSFSTFGTRNSGNPPGKWESDEFYPLRNTFRGTHLELTRFYAQTPSSLGRAHPTPDKYIYIYIYIYIFKTGGAGDLGIYKSGGPDRQKVSKFDPPPHFANPPQTIYPPSADIGIRLVPSPFGLANF